MPPPSPSSLEASQDPLNGRASFFKSPQYAYKSTVDTIFSPPLPSAIKVLFDKVPLVTYDTNPLPARSSKSSKRPRLYVFSTPEDAAAGRPSFNPTCLKWQVCILQKISFFKI